MKKIEEVRIANEKEIGTMGLNLGYLFLKYMGDYRMDNEINILVLQISLKEMEDKLEVLPNDVNTYNLYFIYCHISKYYYENLYNWEKLTFLCECIYSSLLEWAKKFSLPQKPITYAYEKIIASEYFVERNKKYKSKNRKYTCWIEYRNEYHFRTYRLVFQNNKSNEISKYFICEKVYFKDDELMQTDYMKWLNSPRDLKITGWIDNENFEMYWGEEKYIFNAETKTIEWKSF